MSPTMKRPWLVREKEIGIRIVPQVQEAWFDRFDA